jgi:hypothetical protein
MDGFTEVSAEFTQREFIPPCSAEPLAIITLRLSSISIDGLASNLVFHHLCAYLPEAIVHIDLPFEFTTRKGQKDYQKRVAKMVSELETDSENKYKYVPITCFPNGRYGLIC